MVAVWYPTVGRLCRVRPIFDLLRGVAPGACPSRRPFEPYGVVAAVVGTRSGSARRSEENGLVTERFEPVGQSMSFIPMWLGTKPSRS